MIFYTNTIKKNNNTALGKAPRDISVIASNMGAEEIVFYEPKEYSSPLFTKVLGLITTTGNWCRVISKTKSNDVVLVQHPYENIRTANKVVPFLKKRGVKLIVLIHDLPSLRKQIGGQFTNDQEKRVSISDNVLLKKYHRIIAHNNSMISYLEADGFGRNNMISLDIFDYLSDQPMNDRELSHSVVIAGNLERGKCQYVYELSRLEGNICFHLFGREYSGEINDHIIYHGQCPPEELPQRLKGSFGLVWDGESIDTCAGNTGEYLKYNNPHKCSLYLASGLPVIIWNEAAMAKFVIEKGCGITISSLYELDSVINSVSKEEYFNMRKNAERVGQELRDGHYTQTALQRAIESLA